jgi:hypothetical protein
VLEVQGLPPTHRHPDRVGASPNLGRIRQHDLVVPAGLVAEAPGQAHRPKLTAECLGHADDSAQQHRRGVVHSAVANRRIGDGETQAVALVVGGSGRVTGTEQRGEGQQIKLMALEARLD